MPEFLYHTTRCKSVKHRYLYYSTVNCVCDRLQESLVTSLLAVHAEGVLDLVGEGAAVVAAVAVVVARYGISSALAVGLLALWLQVSGGI